MQTNNINVAVPCTKRRLLCCIFRMHCCIWSTVMLNFQDSYALHRLIRHSHIYKPHMSFSLNGSWPVRQMRWCNQNMRWNNLQFLHGTVSVWYHIEGRAHIANQPHNVNSSVSGPQTHNIHVSEPHNLYLASATVSEPQREHQVLSQPNPIPSSALCRPGHTRVISNHEYSH